MPTPIPHKPTHDWIIARKLPATKANEMPVIHGVARPTMVPPHHYAVVLATGPGREHPMTGHTPTLPCKVGDCIMVRQMAGDPETIDGVEYHWFQPDECLAVVDDTNYGVA